MASRSSVKNGVRSPLSMGPGRPEEAGRLAAGGRCGADPSERGDPCDHPTPCLPHTCRAGRSGSSSRDVSRASFRSRIHGAAVSARVCGARASSRWGHARGVPVSPRDERRYGRMRTGLRGPWSVAREGVRRVSSHPEGVLRLRPSWKADSGPPLLGNGGQRQSPRSRRPRSLCVPS